MSDNNPVSKKDLALIEQIIERAETTYGNRIKADRLRKAMICTHRASPIRLNDLLNTCALDFYRDVINGAYRHYDPKTDTIKDGWKPQHAIEEQKEEFDLLKFVQALAILDQILSEEK